MRANHLTVVEYGGVWWSTAVECGGELWWIVAESFCEVRRRAVVEYGGVLWWNVVGCCGGVLWRSAWWSAVVECCGGEQCWIVQPGLICNRDQEMEDRKARH